MKHIIPILIVLLLLSSGFVGVSNTAEKVTVDAETTERDEFLDNLAFYCLDASGSNAKYEYYKDKLLEDYFEDDIEVVEEEITIPVESPQTSVSSGPMDSPWPMQSHDTHHTGRSPYSTVDTWDEIWKFKPDEGAVGETPVIDSDGTIYFGCFFRDFHALYPNGTLKWKYRLGGVIWGSSPAIVEDGTLYVGSWDDFLYAINPNGTRKWKFNANGANIASSPTISDDGTIYFGTLWSLGDGGKIHAVNPNGTEKWYYQTGSAITSDPAIGDDGTIYIGSGDSYLYALYPNGTLRWRFHTGDEIHGDPVIGSDGTIYIGSWDDYFYAINPDGTEKWKFNSGWGTSNCAAIDADGTIYVGTDRLYARNPDGSKKWNFDLGIDRHVGKSSPAISADGIIYVGVDIGETDGGEIIAINSNGTERWRKKIANDWIESSPSIGKDGTVYIGSSSSDAGYTYGYLYAFGVGELEADADGPYYGLINELMQFKGSSKGGYSPHSYHWTFGDGETSDEQNPMHTYTYPSNFTVTLTVTDDSSNTSDDTTWAWIQASNDPPNKPSIDGEANGKVGQSYDYTFETTDPEGLQVWYYIEWGDDSNTGWLGPYSSGEQITKSHTWSEKDTYTIRCKAKDPYEAESDWVYLEVTMPMNQQSNSWWFLQFLQNHPRMFPILRQLLGL